MIRILTWKTVIARRLKFLVSVDKLEETEFTPNKRKLLVIDLASSNRAKITTSITADPHQSGTLDLKMEALQEELRLELLNYDFEHIIKTVLTAHNRHLA